MRKQSQPRPDDSSVLEVLLSSTKFIWSHHERRAQVVAGAIPQFSLRARPAFSPMQQPDRVEEMVAIGTPNKTCDANSGQAAAANKTVTEEYMIGHEDRTRPDWKQLAAKFWGAFPRQQIQQTGNDPVPTLQVESVVSDCCSHVGCLPTVQKPQPQEPEKGQQPQMPEMGQQPQEPEMGQQPQMPEMGQQPQMPEMGQQPQEPEMGQQPQMPEMGQQPQEPEMGQQPQMPEMGQQPQQLQPDEGVAVQQQHTQEQPGPQPLTEEQPGPQPLTEEQPGPQPPTEEQPGQQPPKEGQPGPQPLTEEQPGPQPLTEEQPGTQPPKEGQPGQQPPKGEQLAEEAERPDWCVPVPSEEQVRQMIREARDLRISRLPLHDASRTRCLAVLPDAGSKLAACLWAFAAARLSPEATDTATISPEAAATAPLPPEAATTARLSPEAAATAPLPPEAAATATISPVSAASRQSAALAALADLVARWDPTRHCLLGRGGSHPAGGEAEADLVVVSTARGPATSPDTASDVAGTPVMSSPNPSPPVADSPPTTSPSTPPPGPVIGTSPPDAVAAASCCPASSDPRPDNVLLLIAVRRCDTYYPTEAAVVAVRCGLRLLLEARGRRRYCYVMGLCQWHWAFIARLEPGRITHMTSSLYLLDDSRSGDLLLRLWNMTPEQAGIQAPVTLPGDPLGRVYLPGRYLSRIGTSHAIVQLYAEEGPGGAELVVKSEPRSLKFLSPELRVYQDLHRMYGPSAYPAGFLRLLHDDALDGGRRMFLAPRLLPLVAWSQQHALDAVDRMHALHRAGWALVDVRSYNFMVSASGQLYIIDFGLSLELDLVPKRVTADLTYASLDLLQWYTRRHHGGPSRFVYTTADDLSALVNLIFTVRIGRPHCHPPCCTDCGNAFEILGYWQRGPFPDGYAECQEAALVADYEALKGCLRSPPLLSTPGELWNADGVVPTVHPCAGEMRIDQYKRLMCGPIYFGSSRPALGTEHLILRRWEPASSVSGGGVAAALARRPNLYLSWRPSLPFRRIPGACEMHRLITREARSFCRRPGRHDGGFIQPSCCFRALFFLRRLPSRPRHSPSAGKVATTANPESAAVQREDAHLFESGTGINSIEMLPRELLLAVIDAAPFQLQVYCQLIGLTHGIRTAIRGAPRELSFMGPEPLLDNHEYDRFNSEDEYCLAPCLPADALAAIVGPCKGLVRLTLPPHNRHHPSVVGCGLPLVDDEDEDERCWVDEAFEDHTQLAYLKIPGAGTFWPAIWRILFYLPGLEEFHFLEARPLEVGMFQALATFCPKLRVLHLTQDVQISRLGLDFMVLAPLSGTLKELIIPDVYLDGNSPGSLVSRLHSLERLEVGGWDTADRLRPVAQHLTQFRTHDHIDCLDEAAYRDTLRSLSLSSLTGPSPDRGFLAAPLGGLTHLTCLELALSHVGDCPLSTVLAALPPGLLENQLECLSLRGISDPKEHACAVSSRTLRKLELDFSLSGSCTLTLACPALENLSLPYAGDSNPYELVMDCPHLRSLTSLNGQNLDRIASMPELVDVSGHWLRLGPAWLAQVGTRAPRMRYLSQLVLSVPAQLSFFMSDLTASQAVLTQIFAGCPSLTTLQSIDLHFPSTTDSPAVVLRLPEQLEALDGRVSFEGPQGPAELRVEAPGLRALRLEVPPRVQLTLACPALVALLVPAQGASSFALAEGTDPPLRSLCLERLSRWASWEPMPSSLLAVLTASLLAILTRHGSHLQCVSLSSKRLYPEAWPEVAAALGRLPRLVSLTLYGIPSADMVLACPRLSHLTIHTASDDKDAVKLRSLVLDCPHLEELSAPLDSDLKRFELVGQGEGEGESEPPINCISGVYDPWWEQLNGRFPDAFLSDKQLGE
ncbi:hypothetical protein PAPYR_8938 [Paratrimastix pyriformis]|uniref:Protein kinase domain-containing protein n=1 Tax=Paratrimastix pyriformis TaxID=342808 RepID=A0ABQ8UC27_9EUKA|nr:hypothetical protein PAPYR_8938 [Paratrimastix pyriformis]